MKKIKVLAVSDPAVQVYIDKQYNFLEKFEQQAGIHVDFNIVEWSKYYQLLLNSFNSYKYDIVMVAGHLWLKEFIDKGYLLELKGDFNEDYNYDDIVPSIRKEIELNNKKYLLPSFCDGHMLLYRKSYLNETLEDIVSIEEVIDIVKNSAKQKRDIFILKAHPSEIFLDFLPYLRNEGIDAFDKDGTPGFYCESGIRALEKYISMKKYCPNNVSEFGNQQVLKAIQEGQCKLGVSWGGQIGQIMNQNCINSDDIGFAGLKTSWNVTWSFGINKHCSDKESAEHFLTYITSKEVDRVVGAYCGNPTRVSSFRAGEETFRWYKVLYEMIENAKPLPDLSNTGELIRIVTEEIVKAFNGKQSAQEALHKAFHKIFTIERRCLNG